MSAIPVRQNHRRNRARRLAIGTAVVVAVAGFNGPALYRFSSEQYHEYKINRADYKAANGHWDFLDVPAEFKINSIHASLLHTGKVLLIAGSGNNQKNFDAGKFESVLWDPETNDYKMIPTPKDMFCSGHTQLPDGNLLVAGGTKRYEKLKGDITKAGGLMVVHNEDPDKPITLPAGTMFTGKENGKTFVSKDPVLVEKAKKIFDKDDGRSSCGPRPAWAVSMSRRVESGTKYETGTEDNYRVQGAKGTDARNVYGIAQKLALDKKDFQGIKEAFEFDPVAEKYVKVDPMNEARWYPTLTTLKDGKVLAMSGPGRDRPDRPRQGRDLRSEDQELGVHRDHPEVPHVSGGLPDGQRQALLQRLQRRLRTGRRRPRPGRLGSRHEQVQQDSGPERPQADGDVRDGHAAARPGPEVHGHRRWRRRRVRQVQREVPAGRPEGPELPASRTAPSLEKGTRYPSASLMPDDCVLVTGGSQDYRGRGGSNVLQARMYDPKSGEYTRVADPEVGRNYHSGSVLLPDGRVMIFGSDSLYADKANTKPGVFEQRIEIYTPPYLYRSSRPRSRTARRRSRGAGRGDVQDEGPAHQDGEADPARARSPMSPMSNSGRSHWT